MILQEQTMAIVKKGTSHTISIKWAKPAPYKNMKINIGGGQNAINDEEALVNCELQAHKTKISEMEQ